MKPKDSNNSNFYNKINYLEKQNRFYSVNTVKDDNRLYVDNTFRTTNMWNTINNNLINKKEESEIINNGKSSKILFEEAMKNEVRLGCGICGYSKFINLI